LTEGLHALSANFQRIPRRNGGVPNLSLEITIYAPIERIWEAVVNIESYPELMENVRTVKVLSQSEDGTRISTWSVQLEDSVLEWTEQEQIDCATYTVRFDQLDGDLNTLSGTWSLQDQGEEKALVKLEVQFDIGIPLLADLLDPVAERALRHNFSTILREIERRSMTTP
jgi:ribosome-associated toxin RatA of RatAB toxin-antitoxin module